jgi:hypothetical protein
LIRDRNNSAPTERDFIGTFPNRQCSFRFSKTQFRGAFQACAASATRFRNCADDPVE